MKIKKKLENPKNENENARTDLIKEKKKENGTIKKKKKKVN